MDIEVTSNSVEETISLGEKIGSQLKGGEVIALIGPLGSGKTRLIKGIAAGAGAEDAQRVTSPTFVIMNEYAASDGRLVIYHIDAYRLESAKQLEMIGFDELCSPSSVVLIEWADKVATILKNINCIRIQMSHSGITARKIQFENLPDYMDLS